MSVDHSPAAEGKRTPARRKARQLAKYLRDELGVTVQRAPKKLVEEVYSRLALPDTQHRYDQEISKFPV